jgi:hypothetical protein
MAAQTFDPVWFAATEAQVLSNGGRGNPMVAVIGRA